MNEGWSDVHAAHCCHKHGCKYAINAGDCPVENGRIKQEFPCEYCEEDEKDEDETADAIVAWLENRITEIRAMQHPNQETAWRWHDRADHYEDVVRGIQERAWKK
jgi:hypothetical protein